MIMAVQAQQYPENVGFSLYGSQEWMDSGGGFYEFYLNPQQQQQQQQQHQQQQQLEQQRIQNMDSNTNLLSMSFSQTLEAQIEKQRLEIDRFIGLQNERLRLALQEQRKQQLGIILKRIETMAMGLLRQKDEAIAKAGKKTMELETCLRRAEMENHIWQRIAKEKEAMIITLNNTLEQVREKVSCYSSGAEDAESCCDCYFSLNREEKEEVEGQTVKMACKGCNSQNSCVLFLPCRHLCSCKSCEAFLDCCPVCKSVKKASMEVFMF